ncbi:hypothetical protein CAPTEDRAFT_125155 [Capitella teleta]|uniref:Ecdysone receptor n=1 Tax=Capitella teleta TaxID=283909 RepID=R7TY16_CAPTE|nr:hypothetical protein CAPTEDRAFT_125155 [Capitella teleta]|eukprot:ELT98532.1 hypothetical protein CAPTEDRAFT_125155 [Capitella teleta]
MLGRLQQSPRLWLDSAPPGYDPDLKIKVEADDSYDDVAAKKKRVSSTSSSSTNKSADEELCLICGDRASGYHYNALSCEGCKGFFRRSVTRGAEYVCKIGGNCEMDMWMRRRCQACRLQRCREVGMKEECLLSEEQCKARDVRRKARQRSVKSVDHRETPQPSPDSNSSPRRGESVVGPLPNPLDYISSEHRKLIEQLVLYQEKFELPSEKDLANISAVKISDRGRPDSLSLAIYKHMAEMTILVTQLVVEFAKSLPGFASQHKEDQIMLLKGSACEVMMLRTARRYDVETDTVIFGNGTPFTKDSLRFGGLQDYVDGMFKFCRGMGALGVDNAEYALLTAICLFSERPGLESPALVEQVQELYVIALLSYVKYRRSPDSQFFAKLLMKLTELRTLSVEHGDVLLALKVEKGSLPPLLMEYFDIMEK